MDPPASFSSLPPELVTNICHDSVLRKKDLIALRLTSKSQGTHLSASKEFAKRAFTNIRLLYTRYSLQTFVEICRHPIFGPAVRWVQLSCARFLPDCFEEEGKGLFQWSKGMPRERHEYLDNIRLLIERCDEEEDLKGSGDAGVLLDTAFTALSHWRHSLELCVSSDESRALRQGPVYSHSVQGDFEHWECDIPGTVKLLYLAATFSNCVVQRLHIEGALWDNMFDNSFNSLDWLTKLPELDLNITSAEADILEDSILEEMVTKLLQNTAGLKILHLGSYYSDSYYKCLHKVFYTMSTAKLEKLTLTCIDLDIFNPFNKRIESLRHLELYDCETQRLKNELLSIQKNFPRLEYLLLCGINRPYIKHKVVKLEGVQGVNDGINELLNSRVDFSQRVFLDG
jgi:hypothetical protein